MKEGAALRVRCCGALWLTFTLPLKAMLGESPDFTGF